MTLDIKSYQEQLAELCVIYGIKRLEVFGSAVRADFKPERSDLDILVDFAEQPEVGAFKRYFDVKEALEKLFQLPIDLIEIEAIKNPYFQKVVDKEKVLVYGA